MIKAVLIIWIIGALCGLGLSYGLLNKQSDTYRDQIADLQEQLTSIREHLVLADARVEAADARVELADSAVASADVALVQARSAADDATARIRVVIDTTSVIELRMKITTLQSALVAREEECRRCAVSLAERDGAITARDNAIVERDIAIAERDSLALVLYEIRDVNQAEVRRLSRTSIWQRIRPGFGATAGFRDDGKFGGAFGLTVRW